VSRWVGSGCKVLMTKAVIALLLFAAVPGYPRQEKESAPAKDPGPAPAANTVPEKDKAAQPAAPESKPYVIGAEDGLMIRVWREAELSGEYRVRPDGRITLLLVGEMQASGKTPEELAADITQSLGKYLTQPEVSVAVVAVNSKKYFIIGEVQKTGSFPLTGPTTVLEALVNAGGFRDFANQKKIVIMRRGERLKFNYKDVIAGKRMEQNIQLENGDQIVVP
jgi:polysaccharide biosynthesis/export protein